MQRHIEAAHGRRDDGAPRPRRHVGQRGGDVLLQQLGQRAAEPVLRQPLLDRPGSPATPVWSPDGSHIAFAMRPDGATDPEESEIYVMNAQGGDVKRLTQTPGDDSHPHWSADGRRIFFNSARATPDLKAAWGRQWIDIYSMAADGTDVRRHTDCKSVCTYPVPSPDGRWIAHRRVTDSPGLQWDLTPGSRNSEVFVTAIDDSSSTNVSNDSGFDGWPMWSPDGQWVVFASNRARIANTGQIYAVRPDGKGMRQLKAGPWSRVQPSFAGPDALLVYEGVEDGGTEIGHVARISFQEAGQ